MSVNKKDQIVKFNSLKSEYSCQNDGSHCTHLYVSQYMYRLRKMVAFVCQYMYRLRKTVAPNRFIYSTLDELQAFCKER